MPCCLHKNQDDRPKECFKQNLAQKQNLCLTNMENPVDTAMDMQNFCRSQKLLRMYCNRSPECKNVVITFGSEFCVELLTHSRSEYLTAIPFGNGYKTPRKEKLDCCEWVIYVGLPSQIVLNNWLLLC